MFMSVFPLFITYTSSPKRFKAIMDNLIFVVKYEFWIQIKITAGFLHN